MRAHSNVSRRGSALLIVLGMMAFMVVSAVGFSVYMRQSRVPSSHLRREATARYLLKSALANAIARIEAGIGDDPYPGLNNGASSDVGHWNDRVYAPYGYSGPNETVSTLTLESLGYLPPALINEVRVQSRTTKTAVWENLAYDLGRYAFCAVNVSDCFDINKLSNAKRRTSHSGERISLSALFPDDTGLADRLKSAAGDRPFVSVADFNTTMGNTAYTPFVRYVNNGGNEGEMYLDSDYKAVSNALFVTDTWFPATNAYLTEELELKMTSTDQNYHFDLSTERGQPYQEGDFNKKVFMDAYEAVNAAAGMGNAISKNLGPIGVTCLYDYLDKDQVPLSLAMPTVEAVPMICGLSLAGNMAFKFEEKDSAVPAGASGTWDIKVGKEMHTINRKVRAFCFAGLDADNFIVQGTAMFPFKRYGAEKRGTTSFTVETLAAVFFASDDLRSRLENKAFRPTASDWQNGAVRDGIAFYKGSKSISIKADPEKTSDALVHFVCEMKAPSGAVSMPAFFHVTEEDTTGGQGLVDLDKDVITVDGTADLSNPFQLFDANGNAAKELTDLRSTAGGYKKLFTAAERNGSATQKQNPAKLSGTYRPYVVVWARVLSGGDTVDLAPAVLADDEIHLKGCSLEGLAEEDAFTRYCGAKVPVLPFKDKHELKFDDSVLETFKGSNGSELFEPTGWQSLFAVDPRYNFAPEDWFGTSNSEATPKCWLEQTGAEGTGSGVFGSNGRDRDIFMFTSDQEHLQSIGELQFLPFVQPLGRDVNFENSEFIGAGRYDGNNDFAGRSAASIDKFANGDFFWRTYSAYDKNAPAGSDPYYDFKVGGHLVSVVNGSGDFRLNPLSADSRVMSAVVMNTPWDYYVASTNKKTNLALTAAEGNPKAYAFGKDSDLESDAWTGQSVSSIAARMSNEIRNKARGYSGFFDWGKPYEDLWADSGTSGMGDDQTSLFNVDLGGSCLLHGVDRKYLFSYWRECFQNRQQLFLVFLRAEPLTVGGSGGDSLSNTQLGARGVALVWRDPAPSKKESSDTPPHRTRILFYHQFD